MVLCSLCTHNSLRGAPDLNIGRSVPNSLMPSAKLRSSNLLVLTRPEIEPWPPEPRADAMQRGWSQSGWVNYYYTFHAFLKSYRPNNATTTTQQ